MKNKPNSEFMGYADENRQIWDANAQWWDDRIGDGNDFQKVLIEPATERLLAVSSHDVIIDVACGAGRFARRMAELGATVVALDHSKKFIERARKRTENGVAGEDHVIDAANADALLSLGNKRFHKAVCTMAIMDMPEIAPLFSALSEMLIPGGIVVFSLVHSCFHSASIQRFAEVYEEEAGRQIVRTGIKVSEYLTPTARRTEGIIGQPEPQFYFHRPMHVLFQSCFEAGFVITGMEEPGFPEPAKRKAGVRWDDMPEIPPVMVLRMKLEKGNRPSAAGDV